MDRPLNSDDAARLATFYRPRVERTYEVVSSNPNVTLLGADILSVLAATRTLASPARWLETSSAMKVAVPPAETGTGILASVMLLTYNRNAYAVLALRQILKQNFALDALEVVLVDHIGEVAQNLGTQDALRLALAPQLGAL